MKLLQEVTLAEAKSKSEKNADKFLAAALKAQSAFTAKKTATVRHKGLKHDLGTSTQVHFYKVAGTDAKEITKARAMLKKLAKEFDPDVEPVVTPHRFDVTFMSHEE